jgi:hypothetical protein
MFFSGKRFPLATLSSIDDHMSFFAPSPDFGRSRSLDEEICVYVDILPLEMAIIQRGALERGGGYARSRPESDPVIAIKD